MYISNKEQQDLSLIQILTHEYNKIWSVASRKEALWSKIRGSEMKQVVSGKVFFFFFFFFVHILLYQFAAKSVRVMWLFHVFANYVRDRHFGFWFFIVALDVTKINLNKYYLKSVINSWHIHKLPHF